MGISGDKRAIVFQVTGDPATALQTARNALAVEKFKVTTVDAWSMKASRGSKPTAVLFGAFAPFVEVSLVARSAQEQGVTVIEMDQIPAGCLFAGGLVGAKRSRSHVDAARDHLVAAFTHAGVLRSVSEQ